MKKFASLLLMVLLLVTMLSVFSIPAMAEEDTPREFTSEEALKYISGNCAFYREGEYFLDRISVSSDSTLIIGKNVTIRVTQDYYVGSGGTIIVCGTLDFSGCIGANLGTIKVASCCGKFLGNYQGVKLLDHDFSDGVCRFCGEHCSHEVWDNGICVGCGYVCHHNGETCVVCGAPLKDTVTASVLSEGSLTIIVGVACLVVGFLAAMFIFKKKKPALADGTEKEDE